MGPGVGVIFPEWPPPQLPNLKEHFARLAVRFIALPLHDGEEWRLHFGRDAEAPEVSVTLGPNRWLGPEAESVLGWTPRGYAEL